MTKGIQMISPSGRRPTASAAGRNESEASHGICPAISAENRYWVAADSRHARSRAADCISKSASQRNPDGTA